MGGAVRVGLLCGAFVLLLAALPLPLLLGYLPPAWAAPLVQPVLIGIPIALMFGPLALVMGGLAGFLGGRTGPASNNTALRRGLLAGGITGVAVLLGVMLFFITIVSLLASDLRLRAELLSMVSGQFAAQGGNPALVSNLFEASFIVAGLCAGTVNLVLALGIGALGGLLSRMGRSKG